MAKDIENVSLTREELENFYKDKDVRDRSTTELKEYLKKHTILEMLDDKTIPFSIELKDTYTFKTKAGLWGVDKTNRIDAIGTSLFENTNLEKIEFPNICHIKKIMANAFSGSKLQYVRLPDSLEKIGISAFQNCENLKDVKIPKSVKEIGAYAFSGCTKLSQSLVQPFVVPETVEKIGENAFYGIPFVRYDGEAEDDGNHWGAINFTSKNIEEARKKAEEEAIKKAEEEKRKKAEEEAKRILNETIMRIKAEEEKKRKDEEEKRRQDEEERRRKDQEEKKMLEEKARKAEEETKRLEEEKRRREEEEKRKEEEKQRRAIPRALDDDSIGHLFIEMRNDKRCIDNPEHKEATRLYIPTDYFYDRQKYRISEIGDSFFENSKLEYVEFEKNSIKKIGDSAFKGCKSLNTLTIGEGLTDIGKEAFKNCKMLEDCTLPDSLEEIKDSAFENCRKLEIEFLPNNIRQIGKKAFQDCKHLISVVIPSNVEKIDDRAFKACSSLKALTINEGVQEIGESAFDGCDKLERVEIPSTVVSIGEDAFLGVQCLVCKNPELKEGSPWGADYVEYLNIEKNAVSEAEEDEIEKSSKENEQNISPQQGIIETRDVVDEDYAKQVLCGDSIKIERTYLDRKKNIKYDVKKIGQRAFYSLRGVLRKVVIPPCITEIEDSAFEDCSKLSYVQIPHKVKKIGKNAFKGVPFSSIKYNGDAEGSPWGAEDIPVDIDESYPTVSLAEKQDVKKDSNSLASMIEDDEYVI